MLESPLPSPQEPPHHSGVDVGDGDAAGTSAGLWSSILDSVSGSRSVLTKNCIILGTPLTWPCIRVRATCHVNRRVVRFRLERRENCGIQVEELTRVILQDKVDLENQHWFHAWRHGRERRQQHSWTRVE